jgi:hypothetical protein
VDLLDVMEEWRDKSDPWLSVWGVKFGLDGGLEAGATEEPPSSSRAPPSSYWPRPPR